MLLKSLELKGFKSFADKTIINFNQPVIGIIGPNGCGKSNIIDSIRWVIGEQKISQLRSDNLESLIFNGSKTRNASSLAEVNLLFENNLGKLPSEYSEICISRRFYKSGESEYRINDVSCRLKDIQNLFLDTGISNESYAIIELGMVDDIIKDKDNSRRRMLEQAAGITIYKSRKKETLAKLALTNTDLERINDILFEISQQLTTLENQANKAKKFKELKEEYKENYLKLSKILAQNFHIEFQKIQKELKNLTDLKINQETLIHTTNANIENLNNIILKQDHELQEFRQIYIRTSTDLSSLENSKKLFLQEKEFRKIRSLQLEQEITKNDQLIADFGIFYDNAIIKLNSENETLKNIQHSLTSLKTTLDFQKNSFDSLKQELDLTQKKFISQRQVIFEKEKNISNIQITLTNISKNREFSNNDIASKTNQINDLNSDLIKLKDQLNFLENDFKNENNSIELLKENQLKKQELLDETKQIKVNLEHNRNNKQNQYDFLKNIYETLEGYPESVKFLSKSSEFSPPLVLLSEIFNVNEEYRRAIEYVLEPYLNYFVVSNIGEAIQAYKLLHSNNKGKANFFILDRLNYNQSIHFIPPTQTNLIRTFDLLEMEEKYKSLFKFLLNQVYIDNSNEPGNYSSEVTVVDLNGRWITNQLTLQGGSTAVLKSFKIGRKKNLEKILPEIEELTIEIQNKNCLIQSYQKELEIIKIDLQKNKLKQIQQNIQEIKQKQISTEHRIELLEQQILSINKQIDEMNLNILKLNNDHSESNNELQILMNHYQIENQNINQKQQEFLQIEKEYIQTQKKQNELNLAITKQIAEIKNMQQELDIKSNQNKLIYDLVRDMKLEKESIENLNKKSFSDIEYIEHQIVEKIKEKENNALLLTTKENEVLEVKQSLIKINDELKIIQKNKDLYDQKINQLKDSQNEHKLKIASLSERLKIECNIDIDSINWSEFTEANDNVEVLQEKLDRLKKRIDNFGEINYMAIEAFAEMKTRHDFIFNQKNDLEQAKENLLNTIREVENIANNLFLETYTKVRAHFQEVFKTLFTSEDTADLIMTQPDNLAETNIDIIAKPKGKRPATITQLSGGEKTLTSIALLFSIYLIKPAPFCIFDEVDAPLDDVNIDKFCKLIRQFSKNSQFIIVTHNKQTMSAVDLIYGVTMQEIGVSKIVPVDFRELET